MPIIAIINTNFSIYSKSVYFYKAHLNFWFSFRIEKDKVKSKKLAMYKLES